MVQRESRVKKTLLNARVNLIFYFLTLCLSFFSRKIFLDCLGADFVGLTGTLQNLLGFLNLAELGIGGAIGYLLYKPIFDQDQDKINEIISVMGYLYRWIGLIIAGAGCILSCFLPLIFPETGFDLALIYAAYFAFLGSSLIGYFINYRQNLLGADQRNYVVTAYFQTANIVKTIIQMALAYYTGNLYFWVLIEFTFGVIYSIILNWKINQTYPWLKADVALGRKVFKKYPEVLTKTKQLFVHKIATFVQYQTQPIIIYSFVSLSTVAKVGNYSLVMDKIGAVLGLFFSSASAGIGNLIAEGNKKKSLDIFWGILSVQILVGSFSVFVIYHAINPFISLWVGDSFLMSTLVIILLLINFFISFTRSTVDQFIYGYGLFHDTWAPITECIIYAICALIGGYLFGLPGILSATTISLITIICIWKPIFLFKCGFKLPVYHYWLGLLKYIALSIIAMASSHYFIENLFYIDPYKNILNWILYTTLYSATFLVFCSSIYAMFDKAFRKSIFNAYQYIRRRQL